MTLLLLILMTVAFTVALGAWYYRLLMTRALRASATELSMVVSAMMTYMKTAEFRLGRDEISTEGQLEMHIDHRGIYVKKHPFPEGMDVPGGYRMEHRIVK